MWDLVSEAMGEEWRKEQASALGLRGESFEGTCQAALRLYEIAASEVEALLDPRQRGVVGRTLALIRQSASL